MLAEQRLRLERGTGAREQRRDCAPPVALIRKRSDRFRHGMVDQLPNNLAVALVGADMLGQPSLWRVAAEQRSQSGYSWKDIARVLYSSDVSFLYGQDTAWMKGWRSKLAISGDVVRVRRYQRYLVPVQSCACFGAGHPAE